MATPKVKIYTTPTCAFCHATKEFFREHNIEFKEVNVATDDKAREEMIQKSGQLGVPVIDVGGQLVIGFNRAKLSELLGIQETK